MALFNVLVRTELRLDPAERQAVASIAASLRALVEKLNEPDPPAPDDQAAVDALTERIRASSTTLADEVEKILNPNPQGA